MGNAMSYARGWAVLRKIDRKREGGFISLGGADMLALEHVGSFHSKESAKQEIKRMLDSEPGPFFLVEEWRKV